MSRRKGPRTRRDCAHPKAKHQHGTAIAYTADGCRCDACTDAVVAEANRVRRLKAYGRYDAPNWVDAAPVRKHVRRLMRQGHTVQGIATCAGVDMNRMRMLLWGNPSSGRPHSARIRGAVADRLLSCRMDWRQLHPNTSIDSTGTIRRIRALGAIGWSGKHIAELIGMRQGNFAMIQSRPQVLVATALKVEAVYHRLAMTPAPDNQYTRRLLTMAATKGWVPPLAWDDETIDDPKTKPQGHALAA
ncbi:hypothetical protein [Galactobacter valiniphilus]|uniref:hypothetical protein n=1 Tax=Galactobacter valiniphilus TaxID=2676122 RepID=UPI00373596B0